MSRQRSLKHKWSLEQVKGCQFVKTCLNNACGAWAIKVARGKWTVIDRFHDDKFCHGLSERKVA